MTDPEDQMFLFIFNSINIEGHIRHLNPAHEQLMADRATAYFHEFIKHLTYRNLPYQAERQLYRRIHKQVELEYMKELL